VVVTITHAPRATATHGSNGTPLTTAAWNSCL